LGSVTLALAIWGALIGTIGAVIASLKFVRDQPKLSLGLSTHLHRRYAPDIIVNVQNRGRQPTTIMQVELLSEGEAEIWKDNVKVGVGRFTLGLEDEEPRVVMPGAVARFAVSLTRWPGPIHADEPLRVHVVDSHGRKT
jgi:hypothetical protein